MSNWTLNEKSVGTLEVTVDGNVWEKAVKKAFNKIAREVTIPGFRKGQAPRKMIEKRIPANDVRLQAVEDNANEWMREALTEQNLTPITQPQLDIKEMGEDKAVLTFTFTVMPKAVLGDYKSLEYSIENVEVTDEDVDAEIASLRQRYADEEIKEGPAETGDTVNIDYKGFKDDVAFEGGEASGYDLKLGSNSFIPGFEDALVGLSAGDEKDIDLTFPEDYHSEDLAGAAVVFKVKVNEVKKEVIPELDDEFAQDLNYTGVETVEQLKDFIRNRQEGTKKADAEKKAENDLLDDLAAVTQVDLPDAAVDEEAQNQIQNMAGQLQQMGISLTSYLEMMGKKAEELMNDYRESAARSLKMRLGLEAIAADNNLEVSDEEIDSEIQDLAVQYQMSSEEIRSRIDTALVKQDLLNTKALDLLKNLAKKNASEAE